MNYNPFPMINAKRKLVDRSVRPIYKGNFALTTDVTSMRQFDSCTETMKRAALSVSDAWYIHFKITTEQPADTVRLIPTILQSFNRTRTLRRARVSGVRMCNLYSDRGDWFYVSDMVVSCTFDAMAISTALADYASIGHFLVAHYEVPISVRRGGVQRVRAYALQMIEKFWQSSKLARHSVRVSIIDKRCSVDRIAIEFEPKTLSPLSLFHYILNGCARDLHSVEVGRNSRLTISRSPLWHPNDYISYQPDKVALYNVRYRHCAAFGMFYNNPDFPIY